MRGDKFSSTLLGQSFSRLNPGKIPIEASQSIISIAIKNTSISGQTLWIGINSNDLIEPIEPGQSVAIAGRDNSVIDATTIFYGWDDPSLTDTRIAVTTTGKDVGEVTC